MVSSILTNGSAEILNFAATHYPYQKVSLVAIDLTQQLEASYTALEK